MLIAIKALNAKKAGNQDVFICVKRAYSDRVANVFRNGLFEGHSFGFEQDMFVSNVPMTDVVITNDPTRPATAYSKPLQITFECSDKNLSNNTFQIDAKVFEVLGDFVDLSREATLPLQEIALLDLNNDLAYECTTKGLNFPFKKLFHAEDSIGYKHAQYGIGISMGAPLIPIAERTETKNVFGTSTLRDAGVIRINATLRTSYMCECCGYKKTLTASHFGVVQANCPVCDVDGEIPNFTTKTPANALQRTFVPLDMAARITHFNVGGRQFFKFQAISDYVSNSKQMMLDYQLERNLNTFA